MASTAVSQRPCSTPSPNVRIASHSKLLLSLTHPSTEYAYFFFYSFVRNSYIKRLTQKLPPGGKLGPLSTAAELLLGALAGALAQIFTIPVSVIATRQQVGRPGQLAALSQAPSSSSQNNSSSKSDDEDDSFLSVAREIVEEEGVTGLWLGLKPGLVLTVNPAITYGVFERVKSIMLLASAAAGGGKMSPWMSFLVGALSKTLATIVCDLFTSFAFCRRRVFSFSLTIRLNR